MLLWNYDYLYFHSYMMTTTTLGFFGNEIHVIWNYLSQTGKTEIQYKLAKVALFSTKDCGGDFSNQFKISTIRCSGKM